MKIENLKQLQKLIALCRKTGVEAIEIDGIKMNIGPAPKATRKQTPVEYDIPEASIKIPQYNPVVKEVVADVIKTDGLTDEELLFYSASGQMTEEHNQ